MSNATSVNYKVICEPFTGTRKPEAIVSNGFSTVKQKTSVVGLKVLADARISDQYTIKAGSLIHMPEEFLINRQAVMKPMVSPAIEGQFVFVDFNDILFVSEPK